MWVCDWNWEYCYWDPKVGEQEIGYGRGNSIRVAKREADVEALQYLRASPGRAPAAEDSSGARESDGRARNDSNSAWANGNKERRKTEWRNGGRHVKPKSE
jgi:hypothetical protein